MLFTYYIVAIAVLVLHFTGVLALQPRVAGAGAGGHGLPAVIYL